MVDGRETAEKILLYTGDVENVMQAAHCVIRLRLVLRDPKRVRKAELKDLPLVKGMTESGGQFQIILGIGVVSEVYKEFTVLTEEGVGESLEKGVGDGADNGAQIEVKGGNEIQRISRMFSDAFLPMIPVIVASGVLMDVKSFLTGNGLMATDSNQYNIMAILIDTGSSFFPALIYYPAAKKFGGSSILGLTLSLMVVSSALLAAGTTGKGNAEPILVQLLGTTFKLTRFQGSVLVAIVDRWLTTKIKNMCREFVPDVFSIILTLILTLGISLFVILSGVGPVIHVVEAGVVSAFRVLVQPPFEIDGFVIGDLQQILTILRIHHSLQVTDTDLPKEMGTNVYMPIRTAAAMGQVGVVTSFFCFTKDKKLKALAGSSSIAAWLGTTEPTIFRITLPYSMTFVPGCIRNAFGGLPLALMHLSTTGMGISTILGYLLFLSGDAVEYTLVYLMPTGALSTLTAVYIKKRGIQGNEHIACAHP